MRTSACRRSGSLRRRAAAPRRSSSSKRPTATARCSKASSTRLRPDTRLTVATDVTGVHESIRTMTIRTWASLPQEARALPKLPTVFALLAAPRGRAPRYAPSDARRKGEQPAGARRAALNSRRASSPLRERSAAHERGRHPRTLRAAFPGPDHDGRGARARASSRSCPLARSAPQERQAQHRPLENCRRAPRGRRSRYEGRPQLFASGPA